ncbi:unnamed protein product [Leuciscus chuanchicus]
MLTRQDVMTKNIQEILLRLNQTGGASQGLETSIEIDVAQSFGRTCCLGGKTERASGLQEEIGGYKAYHEGCSFKQCLEELQPSWEEGEKKLLHTTVYQVIKRAIMLSRSGLQDKARHKCFKTCASPQ